MKTTSRIHSISTSQIIKSAEKLKFILILLCFLGVTTTSCSDEQFASEDVSIEEIDDTVDKGKNPLAGKKTSQSWADSFSFKGKCYCKSSYDHGIGNVRYKGKKVRSICEKMKKDMRRALKSKGKKVFYNTVQCGHAPAHKQKTIKDKRGRKQADEVHCPGIVGGGRKCNSSKGPKWDKKYLR